MHNSSLKLFYNFYLSLDVYSVKEKTVSFLKKRKKKGGEESNVNARNSIRLAAVNLTQSIPRSFGLFRRCGKSVGDR